MLNIHIGPHKTATTYIQSILKNSKWKDGYQYYDIYRSRRDILPALNAAGAGALPEFLEDQSQCHILSDENLIGGPQGPINMYPGAASKLKWAKGHSADIFFALRPYDEIFVSSWIESLRFYPYFPFKEGPPNRGYHHVLAEIEKEIDPGKIVTWMYSDFRDNSKDIIQLIASDGIEELGEHEQGDERFSPSNTVVELYQEISAYVKPEKQTEVFRILREHPQMGERGKFLPYSKSDLQRLKERFDKDCEKFKSRYGIWIPPKAKSK